MESLESVHTLSLSLADVMQSDVGSTPFSTLACGTDVMDSNLTVGSAYPFLVPLLGHFLTPP